jgi:hypothetical protein
MIYNIPKEHSLLRGDALLRLPFGEKEKRFHGKTKGKGGIPLL